MIRQLKNSSASNKDWAEVTQTLTIATHIEPGIPVELVGAHPYVGMNAVRPPREEKPSGRPWPLGENLQDAFRTLKGA